MLFLDLWFFLKSSKGLCFVKCFSLVKCLRFRNWKVISQRLLRNWKVCSQRFLGIVQVQIVTIKLKRLLLWRLLFIVQQCNLWWFKHLFNLWRLLIEVQQIIMWRFNYLFLWRFLIVIQQSILGRLKLLLFGLLFIIFLQFIWCFSQS